MNEFFSTNLGVAVILLGQTLAVVGFVMISLLFLVYGDRKIWAAVQMRRGPNVVGLFGLLQTVADALKYVVKEIVIPAGADRPVFILAPLVSFVLAMLAWAVIPFNATWVLADINVALLFVFAVSSLEVYGGDLATHMPLMKQGVPATAGRHSVHKSRQATPVGSEKIKRVRHHK